MSLKKFQMSPLIDKLEKKDKLEAELNKVLGEVEELQGPKKAKIKKAKKAK